ncbi:hypothetical protein N8804_01605 [Methylophilaceae bacterium]|nr:hypothetical protein [Methylophilaceae bacterium]
MKKIVLALTTTLLLPNMSYAAACANGANPAGCTTSTTGIDYTLTGNIAPASGFFGIEFTTGTDTTTTLTGNITTIGDSAHGLIHGSYSSNNISNITGNITTDGNYAYAVYLNQSSGNTSTLTGDIMAEGIGVIGLHTSVGNDNVINITGNITTDGLNAWGVYFVGSNRNTTTLNGNILTNSAYSLLVAGGSSNNNFTIFGDITSGSHGFAMQSGSNYNNLTLTGNINATYHGLQLASVNNNIANISGNITTIGSINPTGLYLQNSANNAISLTGDINSTGSSANAFGVMLYQESDSNTINLTGSLSATGTGSSYAIYAESTSDDNTITFNQGSKIIGGLYNDGTNNTLTFNLGRAASYNFTTSGAVNWVLDDTTKTVIAGSAKSRGVADMDDAGNRLYQRLSQINSSLTNQQRQTRQGYARGDYWIDTYYTDSDRDTSPAQINQHTRGITVGFNASGDRALAMDVIINYENSDAGYGLSEQTVDSNSLMVGVAFPALMTAGDGSLAVKFLAGMSDNDRDLTVLNNTVSTGQEIVTDSYGSTYVTAGASWMQSLYATPRFKSQFLLGMDINHEQIEGSTASAYYRLDDRDITQLVGQAQYGITIQGMNKQLQINGSIGLAHANIIDGENQSYTIDGTAVSYTADKSNTYTTASLGATYRLNPQAYAYANVKQFDSTDDIDGTTGNVGLVVNF